MARTKQPRRRRSPEEAKAELLAAAERVFSRVGPDQAGLKLVASEAGVSHALVTHYFGTYEGLVRAVLQQRIHAARAQALEALMQPDWKPDAAPLLNVLATLTRDPLHVRLVTWAMLSGRGIELIPLEPEGMRALLDGLTEHRRSLTGKKPGAAAREELKMSVLVALTAMYGYALGREAFAQVLEEAPDATLDARFQKTLAEMLQTFIEARDRGGPSPRR